MGAHASKETCASTQTGRAQEYLATSAHAQTHSHQRQAGPPSYSRICGERVTFVPGQERVFPRGQDDFDLLALRPVFSFQCRFLGRVQNPGCWASHLVPSGALSRARGGGQGRDPNRPQGEGTQSPWVPLWAWPAGLLLLNFICLPPLRCLLSTLPGSHMGPPLPGSLSSLFSFFDVRPHPARGPLLHRPSRSPRLEDHVCLLFISHLPRPPSSQN